jgi:uncharacterized membrane protein
VSQEAGARGIQRDSAEFGRVVNFSDAVFAIAMTLLVLQIEISRLPGGDDNARDMLDALRDVLPEIVSFAVSFYVIGRYWLAHHWFFSRLVRLDRRLLSQNLVYLGFVAFLPFPTALIGEYEGNPVAFVVFALAMAAVSLMEVIASTHAIRAGLVGEDVPSSALVWSIVASTFPVVVFLLSIPIAFVNTTVALLSWFILAPVGFFINTRMPPEVRDFFGKY